MELGRQQDCGFLLTPSLNDGGPVRSPEFKTRPRILKLRIASLSLLALCLVALPARADTVYDNGPINGTTDAWTIDFGFVVSNTFTVGSGGASITGLMFGAWLFPGDVLGGAEVQITSSEFGGTTYFDGALNFTQSGCVGNQYGFNVCTETSSPFGPVDLAAGTYWLNLENASVPTGDPIYWDENSGPSQASENSVGTIPSESFTLLGTNGTTSGGSVPEPGGIMLFGAGILSLAALRRKLF
jgi:PEP-CTERM motif-containing protein